MSNALIYILDDELACLKADLAFAVKEGRQDMVAELEDLITQLLDTSTKLREHYA